MARVVSHSDKSPVRMAPLGYIAIFSGINCAPLVIEDEITNRLKSAEGQFLGSCRWGEAGRSEMAEQVP
jgi:hypothetical protein